jgi:predicted DNA-binding transcriptional regulator YafY
MPKKWNDAKPAEKLLSLYSMLLVHKRAISLTELSRGLNCSKQAVTRLIAQLEGSRFGKVLADKRGREAVYRLDRPGETPRVSLNAEGLRQLALCRDFLCHLLPKNMRENLDATLRQAAAFVPAGEDGGMGDRLGYSLFKGRIDYTPFEDMLRDMVRAMRERRVCLVRYRRSLREEERGFAYAPGRLTAFHEALYVSGWVVSGEGKALPRHDSPTTLAVHRLRAVSLTRRDGARLPEVGEPDAEAFGLMEEKPFRAKIRFSASAATDVAEREWSGGQKMILHRDGALTLSMNARSRAELLAWILSFGGAAEALAPAWLREEAAKQAEALAGMYGARGKANPASTA